jgi:hypothetical protein
MFVKNCVVDETQVLHYPRTAEKKKGKKKSAASPAENAAAPLPDRGSSEDRFHPVRCVACTTQVGVYDQEEVYHFFNVLSSYS